MLKRFHLLVLVTSSSIIVLAIYPMLVITLQSLGTGFAFQSGFHLVGLANFANLFSDSLFQTTIKNTLEFALGVTILTTLFGIALALAFAYLSFPFRRALETLILLPILISPLSLAIGWVFIAAPGGYIPTLWENLFGFSAPWDVYSFPTVVIINAFYLVPVIYLYLTPALRSIDASYEEACRVCGAGPLATIWRIIIPMIKDAILAAVVLIVLDSIEQFSIPLILLSSHGVFLATTYVSFLDTVSPPQYGAMAATGILIIIASALLIVTQRRIAGARYGIASLKSGFKPIKRKAMHWLPRYLTAAIIGIYGLVAVPLPLLGIAYRSVVTVINPYANQFSLLTLNNFLSVFDNNYLSGSLINTLEISLIAASLGIVLSIMVAYSVIKSKSRGSGLLDYLATAPMAVPGIVMGVGFMFAWSRVPLPIYGTIWIMVMAFITRYLPLGFRTCATGMSQIEESLDHSFRVCGGSSLQSFFRIILPLMRPAIASAWVLLFIHFVYELSTAYLLYSFGNQVSTVVMVQLFQSDPGALSAIALIQFFLVIAVFVPFRKSVSSVNVFVSE